MEEDHVRPAGNRQPPLDGERRTVEVSGHGPPPPYEDEISLLQLLSVLLKHRRAILAFTLAAVVLVVVFTLFSPRTYTAHASFFPQEAERSRLGGAAALAGQLGISIPTGEPGRSPQFYADLLRSREVLARVLADTFTVSDARWGDTVRNSGTLIDLVEIDGETEPLRRERGVRWLRDEAVRPSTNQETGLVEVEVTTPWPAVSHRISERLLDLLNDFNLQQRQSQAVAERSFIEERRAAAQEELLEAEEGLKGFLENNRQFQNSPELVFEHDRLQRQVAMRQEIFTSLAQSYEEARISEVRNTPVITVVERPEVPPQGDPRGLALKVALGLLLGGMLGVIFAFGREMLSRSREESDEDYREFHVLWEETVDEVRRPIRRLVGKGEGAD